MRKKILTKELGEIKENIEALETEAPEIKVFVVQSLEQEQKIGQEFNNKKDRVILIRCY